MGNGGGPFLHVQFHEAQLHVHRVVVGDAAFDGRWSELFGPQRGQQEVRQELVDGCTRDDRCVPVALTRGAIALRVRASVWNGEVRLRWKSACADVAALAPSECRAVLSVSNLVRCPQVLLVRS